MTSAVPWISTVIVVKKEMETMGAVFYIDDQKGWCPCSAFALQFLL